MLETAQLPFDKDTIRNILNFDFLVDDVLLSSVFLINLAEGQILFGQGELADSCFIVISGVLKIIKKSTSGETILTLISKGEIGGALLMGNPQSTYPGSVVALTRASLLIIPKDTYINHWTKNPKAANFIHSCIQKRIQQMQEDKLLQLSDVETRVLSFLYRHYLEKKDLVLKKITRKDIALAIGAKTETVIRTLKKLERAGIVKTTNSIISIVDHAYFNRTKDNE